MVVRGMRDKGHVAPLPPLPRLYLPALVCTPRARLVLVCTPVAVPACCYRRRCCRCSCCWCLIRRLSSLVPGSRLHSHSSALVRIHRLSFSLASWFVFAFAAAAAVCAVVAAAAMGAANTAAGPGGSPRGGEDKVISIKFNLIS